MTAYGPPGVPPSRLPGDRPTGASGMAAVAGWVAVAILVVLTGAVVVFLITGGPGDLPGSAPAPSASRDLGGTGASPGPTPSVTSTGSDISRAGEGDCLRDADPSDTSARLSFVPCQRRGEDHYRVLRRFEGTTDAGRCEQVPGYDSAFSFGPPMVVLCVEELV